MDKRLILAVAGSGKTTYLINQMDLTKRFLIITYTNNNTNNLRSNIIKKFGYFPNNVMLLSYFQFLWIICYCPYLKDKCNTKGIIFKTPPLETNRYRRTSKAFYMTREGYLYHNRIAKLCQEAKLCKSIANRIDKYFDCFYFDEIQDLGGHDFNLISQIIPPNADVLFVGDFYQHTFDTSRDGNTNRSLHNDFAEYCEIWSNSGLNIDTKTLSKSYRCSPTICNYVKSNLGIPIYSHRQDECEIVLIENQIQTDELIKKGLHLLFYQNHSKYLCKNLNWGESKGLDDFTDIGIVLNKETLKHYNRNTLDQLSPSTKNKFYVACTRAKRNIYFIPYNFLDKYKISNL